LGVAKSNADVRSPQIARRHAVMLVSIKSGRPAAKRRSMNRMSEVWSNVSEQTQPPLLHGETTIIGTRTPRP
jgi:hypothetical protein